MVRQMASCVQESHHLEQHLLLRHYIFSLATYHTTPRIQFLRATAVPAGTAEAHISYGNSVCPSVRPSVRHGPVQKQPSDIETPGLHHMIA